MQRAAENQKILEEEFFERLKEFELQAKKHIFLGNEHHERFDLVFLDIFGTLALGVDPYPCSTHMYSLAVYGNHMWDIFLIISL